jgi:DNA mismatch endonuclease, patch repair protein
MKVPRFESFGSSSESASRAKRANRAKDTKAEMLLRQQLWHLGMRYRLHAKDLPGRPDIIFRRKRIVVFCDGDFWHGRDWLKRKRRLRAGANAPYWLPKIAGNRLRDARITACLKAQGWTVVRIWETDVLKDPEAAVQKVISQLERK